jgi:hypothetical protein
LDWFSSGKNIFAQVSIYLASEMLEKIYLLWIRKLYLKHMFVCAQQLDVLQQVMKMKKVEHYYIN